MKPGKEIYEFIEQKILWCLNNVKLTKGSKLILFSGLLRLRGFNLSALDDCYLSFSDGENHLYVVYGSDKLEVSDYHSADSGMGFDHYQTFCYQYYFEEDKTYNDGPMIIEDAERAFDNIVTQRGFKYSISTES